MVWQLSGSVGRHLRLTCVDHRDGIDIVIKWGGISSCMSNALWVVSRMHHEGIGMNDLMKEVCFVLYRQSL